MRALPTDRAVIDWFDQLRRFAGVDDKTAQKPSNLNDLQTVVLAALSRARRAGSNTVDGFSASAWVGSGHGGGAFIIDEETGESVPVTSVESAAMRRLRGTLPDPNDDLARRMAAHIETMVTAYHNAMSAANAWRNLTVDIEDLNERKCHPCSKAGIDHSHQLRRVTVGDVVFDVCQWAYEFFKDVGAFPSPRQCREHDERGYTKRRIDPTQLMPKVS